MLQPDTYSVAQAAFEKLNREAAFKEHNLRRLVAHCNLYDKLLEECYAARSTPPPQFSEKSISSPAKINQASEQSPGNFNDVDEKNLTIESALGLCRVQPHTEEKSIYWTDGYPEVEVAEVEILEDD